MIAAERILALTSMLPTDATDSGPDFTDPVQSIGWFKNLHRLHVQFEKAQAALDAARELLKVRMDALDTFRIPGLVHVTYKENQAKNGGVPTRFDSTQFQKDHPVLAGQYRIPDPKRPLRVDWE